MLVRPSRALKDSVIGIALVLAACATSPRNERIADLDLSDSQVLSRLGEHLSVRERGALATYALLHWPGSKAFCGQPVFRGPQPQTVGEAIEKTLEYESDLAAKRAAESAPRSPIEQREWEERTLIDEFDQLTLDRDMLTTSDLPKAELTKKLKEIDRKMEENRRARRELAAKPIDGI